MHKHKDLQHYSHFDHFVSENCQLPSTFRSNQADVFSQILLADGKMYFLLVRRWTKTRNPNIQVWWTLLSWNMSGPKRWWILLGSNCAHANSENHQYYPIFLFSFLMISVLLRFSLVWCVSSPTFTAFLFCFLFSIQQQSAEREQERDEFQKEIRRLEALSGKDKTNNYEEEDIRKEVC